MPVRTAITVTTLNPYQEGANLTRTAGDAANDHSLSLSAAPKLILLVINTSGVNVVNFTIELPACKATYNETVSIAHTMAAAGNRVIPIDIQPDLAQTGNVLHIDSADANFSDLRFMAFTWPDTPVR